MFGIETEQHSTMDDNDAKKHNKEIDKEIATQEEVNAKKEKKSKRKKSKKKKSKNHHKEVEELDVTTGGTNSNEGSDDSKREMNKRKRDGCRASNDEDEGNGSGGDTPARAQDDDGIDDARKGKTKKRKTSSNSRQRASNEVTKSIHIGSDENESDRNNNLDNGDSDDDGSGHSSEDEDRELLEAAAAWAEQRREQQANTPSGSEVNKYSLHMTQLPYDANEWDIRQVLSQNGCGDEYDEFGTSNSTISSIRLVYDRDSQGRKTLFRGVAFVDFTTIEAYKTALSLHHKVKLRGRKLNLRPTKTKNELAQIVSQTQALIEEAKMQQQRKKNIGQHQEETKAGPEYEGGASKKHAPKKSSHDGKKNAKKKPQGQSKNVVKKRDHPSRSSLAASPRAEKTAKDADRKLTKKERNRRAAIILSKQRKGAKGKR